jgi:ABC-type spermidine/putrescine transport system permease subunit I
LLLPWILSLAVGFPFFVKLVISGAFLIPLGFLMGMPFPTGLKLVETVEWAWALNAAASVLGSVMAMVIAIHFGLTVTLACAAIAYLLAAAFARTWRRASPA